MSRLWERLKGTVRQPFQEHKLTLFDHPQAKYFCFYNLYEKHIIVITLTVVINCKKNITGYQLSSSSYYWIWYVRVGLSNEVSSTLLCMFLFQSVSYKRKYREKQSSKTRNVCPGWKNPKTRKTFPKYVRPRPIVFFYL